MQRFAQLAPHEKIEVRIAWLERKVVGLLWGMIQLYAFDILALDGDDLRKLPLHLRKTDLARLLARRADGIHLAPFEQGEIGPDLFKAACDLMLEGLVSKRRDSRYQAGTSRDWIKVKNQAHPAMTRVKDAHNGLSR
jgi:bifunctional non-homologous end joining protein LigD